MALSIFTCIRHSDLSLLDGFGMAEEYALRAPTINQNFLTISDHGMLGVIPRQVRACERICDKRGKDALSPIFACELYCNSMQPDNPDDMKPLLESMDEDQKKRFRASAHLLAIAYSETGYKNLVRLSSWGWTNGFYRRPRVNHEQLLKHKEGLFFTSCCYNSEIGRAYEEGGDDLANDMIERYIEMFGKDHFFLEIMLLDFKKQKPYDEFIVRAYRKYGLKIIVTNDCLVDGTLVWTDKGFRLIEDVCPGNKVLTHMGRYRNVEIAVSRKVRVDEQVYEVRAAVGSYSFRATGNHKIYVHRDGKYDWVPTAEIKKGDSLVYPDYSRCGIYCHIGVKSLDLKHYFSPDDFHEREYVQGRNFGSSLRIEDACFVSHRGFSKDAEVRIPTELQVDEDLLKVLGWYVAEGWSDTNSYQVGFALHAEEQDVADFLISYFARFGIHAKTYKVSDNGIAVRFFSKVFNRVLTKICGKGANNKHLPYCGDTWVGKWSQEQMRSMLACVRLGDGSDNGVVLGFHSTSRNLIYEVATAMNGFGFLAVPSVDKNRNPRWKPCWHLNFSGKAGVAVRNYLSGKDSLPQTSSFWKYDSGNWLVKVQKVVPIEYEGNVHDFQVEEDHSFTANMAVVSNCHYCAKEDSKYQRLMLMVQTGKSIREIEEALKEDGSQDMFELQDANLWMKSEEELNEKWVSDYSDAIPLEVFEEAKRNTVEICRKAKGVKLDRSLKLPNLPDADDRLRDEVKRGFLKRNLPKTREYVDRLKEEISLITRKGFSSYFLIQKMMTDEARRVCGELLGWGDGSQAVGPGRGSAVGALVCYCLGITNVDPVREGLLFSRFLSEARGGRSLVLEFKNIDPLPPDQAFE